MPLFVFSFPKIEPNIPKPKPPNSDGLDPGEAGLLVGNIISSNDDSPLLLLEEQLFCGTVYWDAEELLDPENQDPDYECGDEAQNISAQYLDCLCGADGWRTPQGSGQEEPFEAALLATCRSKDSVPESCYYSDTPFSEIDLETNDELFRENSEALIIFIGDEGDNSRRIPMGDSDPSVYQQAFSDFQKHNFTFITLGPSYDANTSSMSCNSGGTTDWATMRLYSISVLNHHNEGLYFPLEVQAENGDCEQADFSEYMAEINDLIYTFD